MVLLFSFLLLIGIAIGQCFDFTPAKEVLSLITSICLAYIMIEVGLEFSVDQKKISSYGWDFVVAAIAAILPAILWAIYFIFILHGSVKTSLLSSLSCAPTSAGVLFAMMMAAGLGSTWVFKKARTLAVLDDLVTILLLIPLEIIIHGFEWQTVFLLGIIVALLFASFRWRNCLKAPLSSTWMLGYAAIVALVGILIKNTANIDLEVLIPAFMLGCLIKMPAHPLATRIPLDTIIKGLFMILVGCSFPKIAFGQMPLQMAFTQVLILTLLSNLGKSFPILCYRTEASFKERLALSIAMFPRGEVGAAILLITVSFGLTGTISTLAMLSLAFNLLLTGLFIWIVLKILNK